MKKEISILAIFVGLIAVAMVFSGCGRKATQPTLQSDASQSQETMEQKEEEKIGKPWVEVVMEGAFVVVSEEEKLVLKTGDELNEGEIIETDKSGLANVYFPDGSVARMDSNTKIQITTGLYDHNTKSLKVRISLMAGNMWSKIIKLATPESVWEVKTSNAVAAVRGSAFGSSFIGKKTTIIGSEHNVSVSPIDPGEGDAISQQEAQVGEKQVIVISADKIAGYLSGSMDVKNDVKEAGDSIYLPTWVASSIEADKLINIRLSELQSQGLSEDESRKIYGQEILNKFSPAPRQSSVIISTDALKNEDSQTSTDEKPATQKPESVVETETTTDGSNQTDATGAQTETNPAETGTENNAGSDSTSTENNTDDTWSDIPVATGTSPNLGNYFIEETVY